MELKIGKGKNMGAYLLISDAAKEVKVESHVLRYWEEELRLPIKRNELGHRYYTQEDVERFRQIKAMKERGLQLKAIKMILKNGRLDVLPQEDFGEMAGGENAVERERALNTAQDVDTHNSMPIDVVAVRDAELNENESGYREDTEKQFHEPVERRTAEMPAESREEKARRLQWLLQQLFRETLRENNEELCRNMKESIIKELDYQFRNQEEREEERDRLAQQRSDEYYQKMDELLRKKSRRRADKPEKKPDKKPLLTASKAENKKKRHFVF